MTLSFIEEGCLRNDASYSATVFFFRVVSLRLTRLFIIETHHTFHSNAKMINEENELISNEEINEEGQRILPIPELAKDFALVLSTAMLLFTLTIAFLGAWRRRIVQEDPMTTEFQKLMERGNNLAKED